MSVVRSTLIFCITLFISISMYVLFKFYEERYVFIAQDKGVFIFDRRNEQGSQCFDGKCQSLAFKFNKPRVELFPEGLDGPGIVVPKGVTVPYEGAASAENSQDQSRKNPSYYIVPGMTVDESHQPQSQPAQSQPAQSQPQPQSQLHMAAHPEMTAPPPGTTVTPPTATVTPPPLPQHHSQPQQVSEASSQQQSPSDFDMPPLPPPSGYSNNMPPTGLSMGGPGY